MRDELYLVNNYRYALLVPIDQESPVKLLNAHQDLFLNVLIGFLILILSVQALNVQTLNVQTKQKPKVR